MHILIVHARVKAEFIDAFKQATAINAENSAKEPGVARFDFLQQQDDLSKFVLYEVYRDDDAPAKHKQTAHYNAWVEQGSHMFQKPRRGAFYSDRTTGQHSSSTRSIATTTPPPNIRRPLTTTPGWNR